MGKQRKKGGYGEKDDRTQERKNLDAGRNMIRENPLFCTVASYIGYENECRMEKGAVCFTTGDGWIYINEKVLLTPKQWVNVLVHCRLHHAFGHFDAAKMPGYEVEGADGKKKKVVSCDKRLWNLACDAYISRFLETVKFGENLYDYPFLHKIGISADENDIYEYLLESGEGDNIDFHMDMRGLEKPNVYDASAGEENRHAKYFAWALASSVEHAVYTAGGHGEKNSRLSRGEKAAQWFINRYPLLGGLAASFRIVEDCRECIQREIRIAAVDTQEGEIYVNPSAGLDMEELKFVLAHEYLHAGLQHQERCQGRDPYLWNVACDFVINAWLIEMEIGDMPEEGLLYDKRLEGMSAEEIYDMILENLRELSKLATFRGYGKGDIIIESSGKGKYGNGTNLDSFYKEALSQGLEYQQSFGRGNIPRGLVEEIRALAMPAIPWDVKLARWFEQHFTFPELHRSYARPSRRQGATPDIPRPRYIKAETPDYMRTFGVVVDTSGSMTAKEIGMALGSIASYAAAREVPYARVVFCDASAYDAGYLAPEDIAGRVEIKGRGGTALQKGVDLLEKAEDFPKDGPILIITDGMIENRMRIRHEHAFLIPKGKRLPFRAKGEVFYFE